MCETFYFASKCDNLRLLISPLVTSTELLSSAMFGLTFPNRKKQSILCQDDSSSKGLTAKLDMPNTLIKKSTQDGNLKVNFF